MKYRHEFHAGNFADVHKHVLLLALLQALKRKDKGFLYLETHAGAGSYRLPARSAALETVLAAAAQSAELGRYARAVAGHRKDLEYSNAYPGSPVLAAAELREQDRAVLIESQPGEARALRDALQDAGRARIECADGFERLRAHLPPAERRGLVLVDPPYENNDDDFERAADAIEQGLRRFSSCVLAVWYPIKKAADLDPWHARIARAIPRPTLVSELWLFPTDSRVALNGSGMLVVNPPYRIAERMQIWLPELTALMDAQGQGGASVRWLVRPV